MGRNLRLYGFSSEMVNHSSTHKEVMLAGLPDVHIQLGYAGKKVRHLSPHAEAAKQFDVKPCAELENSGRGPGFARVGPARRLRGILFEIAEASARTHPGRNPVVGEKVSAQCRRNEK